MINNNGLIQKAVNLNELNDDLILIKKITTLDMSTGTKVVIPVDYDDVIGLYRCGFDVDGSIVDTNYVEIPRTAKGFTLKYVNDTLECMIKF